MRGRGLVSPCPGKREAPVRPRQPLAASRIARALQLRKRRAWMERARLLEALGGRLDWPLGQAVPCRRPEA